MKCYCGGELVSASLQEAWSQSLMTASLALKVNSQSFPYHKKRRIRKKWAKREAERRYRLSRLVGAMMAPVLQTRMGFQCLKCGNRKGLYQAVAESMIQIEPMPSPAGMLSYYIPPSTS